MFDRRAVSRPEPNGRDCAMNWFGTARATSFSDVSIPFDTSSRSVNPEDLENMSSSMPREDNVSRGSLGSHPHVEDAAICVRAFIESFGEEIPDVDSAISPHMKAVEQRSPTSQDPCPLPKSHNPPKRNETSKMSKDSSVKEAVIYNPRHFSDNPKIGGHHHIDLDSNLDASGRPADSTIGVRYLTEALVNAHMIKDLNTREKLKAILAAGLQHLEIGSKPSSRSNDAGRSGSWPGEDSKTCKSRQCHLCFKIKKTHSELR